MLVVVLPIFNEASGISEFLHELNENLDIFSTIFVAVDDKSTDDTNTILTRMKGDGFPIVIIQNEVNKGHGYSVITGIKKAIDLNPDSILLCDGDGQFRGGEVKNLVNSQIQNPKSIVEGVRIGRNNPWFRRLISFNSGILVWLVCGKMPSDANTPLRVLSRDNGMLLLNEIKDDCLTPNLVISAFSRVKKLEINELKLTSIPPRRSKDSIDQWKQRTDFLPSIRLIKFVFLATISWRYYAKQCLKFRKLNSAIGKRIDN